MQAARNVGFIKGFKNIQNMKSMYKHGFHFFVVSQSSTVFCASHVILLFKMSYKFHIMSSYIWRAVSFWSTVFCASRAILRINFRLWPVVVAEQMDSSPNWLQTPMTGFSRWSNPYHESVAWISFLGKLLIPYQTVSGLRFIDILSKYLHYSF